MKTMVNILKALSDRNRLRIMAALTTHRELCACQITELLQVTGATASRHLSVLSSSGLTISRKEGRWVYYRLPDDTGDLKNLATLLDWMKTEFSTSDDIKTDIETLKKITACDPEDLCRKQRGEACCPL